MLCELSAALTKFIISKAVVCSSCLRTYVCRTCLNTVINVLGYLFYIFTAPALVVSPEVHADQGRGAVMFPAGFWRAADRDALRSDHLNPLWRLLLIQRDGAAIKPHISQTTWWRERKKEEEGAEERGEKNRVCNVKRHTKTPVLRQNLLWTHIYIMTGV